MIKSSRIFTGETYPSETISPTKVTMSLNDATKEHEELVNFLKHPTPEKDHEELKEQGGELNEMLQEKHHVNGGQNT